MRLLPLLAALLCLLALGGACSGDGDKDAGGGNALALEEYYQQLAAAFDTLAADVSAVVAEAAAIPGGAGIDEQKQIATSFITDFAAPFASFAEEAGGLEPPAEASDAHAELVVTTNDFVFATIALLDQIEATQSPEELGALFGDEAVAAAGQRSETACNDLQSIADDNHIDVQLNCGLE